VCVHPLRPNPTPNTHPQALEDLYTHYDNTVRNAAGGIVQFVYGDDGMDPVTMEGNTGSALDFDRVVMKVRAPPTLPCQGACAARLCAPPTPAAALCGRT